MSSNLFSNQYPYTDAHELNLDWVISETQGAITTATVAKTAAESAKVIAEGVSSIADNALNVANSAKTTADEAKAMAQTAQTTANEAKTAAQTAQNFADEAQNLADVAQTTADKAKTVAQTAQTTADEAKTVAQTAQTTAESAQSTADEAKAMAQTAQSGVSQLQNQLLIGNYAKYTKFSFKGGTNTGVFTANGEITSGSIIVIIGVYDDTESHAVGGYAAIPLVINGVLNTMLPFGRVDGGTLGIVISLQGTSGIKISGTITKYTYYVDLLDLTNAPTV